MIIEGIDIPSAMYVVRRSISVKKKYNDKFHTKQIEKDRKEIYTAVSLTHVSSC